MSETQSAAVGDGVPADVRKLAKQAERDLRHEAVWNRSVIARAIMATTSDLQAQIDRLTGELQRFRDERSYVVGHNDGFAAAQERATEEPTSEYADTIKRVWEALGNPAYETLKGCTISEVVADYVARAEDAEDRNAVLEASLGRVREDERDRLYAKAWIIPTSTISRGAKVWLSQQGAMLPADRASLRAALAESPVEARPARVKALEWRSEPPYSVARPFLGLHYATEAVWIDWGRSRSGFDHATLSGPTVGTRTFRDLEAAKAAAQADFDARILSALVDGGRP